MVNKISSMYESALRKVSQLQTAGGKQISTDKLWLKDWLIEMYYLLDTNYLGDIYAILLFICYTIS